MDLYMDPETLAKILGFSMGFLYGESFSELDFKVKYVSQWFKNRSQFWQWFVASLLDTQHHFQFGLALMLIVQVIGLHPLVALLLYYAGLGLVTSDLKDYEYVLSRLGLAEKNGKTEVKP